MCRIIFSSVYDFFLPRLCLICDKKLSGKVKILCSNCFLKIEKAEKPRITAEFNRKFLDDKIISGFDSAFVFHEDSVLQSLVHDLKYKQNYHIGRYLGIKSAEIMADRIKEWDADIILPIPLHKLKKAERGFNQAAEIAKGVSEIINIPYKTNLIQRDRFTETQTNLNLIERKENIKDAFRFRRKELSGAKIIIVDDVITTGATVTECAKLLIINGAEKVYAISLAVAA